MQKKHRLKSNIFLRLAGLLLLLVLFTVCIMPKGLYARYITSSEGRDSAKVAKFVFDVKDTNEQFELDLSDIKEPGDSVTYEFTVTNKMESVISEVSQRYTLNVEYYGNLPLEYSMTKDGESLTAVGDVFSDSGAWNAGQESKVRYQLVISWPETEKAYVEDGLTTVYLTVRSEQID